MKRYTPEKLAVVLADQLKWARGEDGGKRAYLQGAYLQGADLRGAYLRGAYLQGADLQDLKIKALAVFSGLYAYVAMPIIADDGTEWVKLGCHTRKVSEWEANFWNNDNEFPNDGSTTSQRRLMAYNTCKEWLRIHRVPAEALPIEPEEKP